MAAIIEDTRQQAGKHDHVSVWMASHGVEFLQRHEALPFGDYMADGSNVAVDTKRDLYELAGNVGKDHARFVREMERARTAGYRLVVLIEQHPAYNDREKLKGWRNRRGRIQGPTLEKMLTRLEENHAVRFEFCHKRDTARRICELLGVDYGLQGENGR